MMAGLRKERFTEADDTQAGGQENKADVLERGNELLEQYGEMERQEFSEAIGQDKGMSTATAKKWVGQLSNNHAQTSPWRNANRNKKEYISFKPMSEDPGPASTSADKPCVVRKCMAPRATGSAYCAGHGELPAASRGKGGGNA